MNNIYKVIWSKAKNCYVVASEIARSHTKSATGSEKIGGVTRRSLLASLMALSLLCGGLGAASATLEVVNQKGTDGTVTIYTQDEVDKALEAKGAATEVASNKTEIDNLKKAVGDLDSGLTKKVVDQKDAIDANTKNIDTNQAAINSLKNDKLDKVFATSTFAAKTELNEKANTDLSNLTADGENKIKNTMLADMNLKADKTTVDAVAGKVTTLETTVGDASSGLVQDVNDLKTQGTALNNALGNKADKSDLDEAKAKIAENGNNITELQTKTQKIDHNVANNTTSVNGMKVGQQQVDMGGKDLTNVGTINGIDLGTKESGKYISQDGSIWGNLKTVDTQVKTNADAIAKETEDRKAAIGELTVDGKYIKKGMNVSDNLVELDKQAKTNADKIQTNANNIKNNKDEIARVNGELVKTNDYFNKELGKTNDYFNKELGKTNAALQVTNKRTAGINRIDATSETTIENNVKVDNRGNVTAKGNVTADGKLKGEGVDAGTGAITTTGAVNAGSLNVTGASHLEGDVTMDKTLSVTGDTKLKKTDVDGTLNVTGASDLKGNVILGTNAANTVTVNGKSDFKAAVEMENGLTVTSGNTTLKGTKVDGKLTVTDEADLKNTQVDGTLSVNKETTLNDKLTAKGEATFKENVTMEKDLEVKGELKTEKITMENKKTDPDGTRYNSSTTITADGITHIGEVEKNGVITKSQFTHTEEGSETYATKGDKTDWTETRSDVKADGVKTEVKDSKGNRTNTSQTTEVINGFAIDEDGNSSTTSQTAKDINGNVTDKDGNKTDMKVTATENSIQIQDKDGKNTNLQVNTMGSSKTEITNGDGKTTKTEQTATDITNTAEQGTIKNNAMNIENNATGNITNTAQNGTIKNEAKDIVNNATGDMTNTVGGKLTTTVTGQATENFNGGLDTNVTGTENHTVTGDQNIHVTKNQTNKIDGNQENTIGGNQTTTVEGKVTENYKAGQATNVTGDQDIKVSGTQTTTATDIKRNASSGMIDTIDNDYGTNTETKVAGKTTTDVSIKGTGEKGQYIRGANESRDYLIKGTLKNSETKTVEKTSTEITDGNGKTSATVQDVTDLAGSVTNGKETGVSGIHANKDGSVSIDSAVAGGGMSSVINQKKDSITSAVGDSTSSTVILQDKDNVTIASSNGAVGIVGKDIVNNAQATITNTAGTSITNQVNDSKVTTDANGTTFENNTPAVSDGGATTTKINGNQITTGRVDANELGVSDKDGTNTADLSVKVGEGVKASASDGTTTGSLDVTADEVGSTVKDASGKGSTFKQRIDAIMMESKNVSIKAEEALTNEAKVITNKASEVINNEAININNTATGIIKSKASEIQNQADRLISNKVGENTWENMEDGKITTSIKNGTKQNLTQSDAEKTEHSVVNGSNSTVNKQTSEEITDAVTNGTTTNVTQNTATSSNNTIADKNGNANTVISTADGTSFINSDAMTPVTGASGAGTHLNTTIKGNTITTGKVTMDYAEVMKDLGVRGNANITGKTTTGSLEVTGTSTLKGNVTMESNATVKKDLTVEGNTNLKNTKVDGTLNVTGKATFSDDVDIKKNLSVVGDVTANSYKVGDKTYIDKNGIHANGQKITDVADGSISEGSKDAVNGGQLYTVKNDLEGKVNKVGANATAMANLHPMEFDPDSKWNIAAAIGNYGSETAAALGAFYRPNDDVMVNLSTAFGTGENMVGGGVSVRLGKGGNKLSREENNALKDQVNDLTARMDALLSVLNPNMSKDFPDVPENHWAYEAVSRLAGNDIVQGYPDGEFHGERTMTRYEMAEIIYNALSRGAEAEKELVEEFKPELQAMAASEKATAERAEG